MFYWAFTTSLLFFCGVIFLLLIFAFVLRLESIVCRNGATAYDEVTFIMSTLTPQTQQIQSSQFSYQLRIFLKNGVF